MLKTNRLLQLISGLAMTALGALLFTLAFPPYGLWPLAFIWMVPVMIAVHRVLPSRLAGLGLGVGVGGFFWGYFGGMFEGYSLMQYLPLVIGAIATLIGSRERSFHARTGYKWLVLQGAVVWVGIEMIRGFIPVAGTWGFAAYTLYEQPWLIQPVSIFGIYGMSLMIMLFNFALAMFIIARLDLRLQFEGAETPVSYTRALYWLCAVVVLMALWGISSLCMHRQPVAGLKVAAIQPGVLIGEEQNSLAVNMEEGLKIIKAATMEASREGARLIVWPEGYLPFDPQEEQTAFFRDLAQNTGAYLTIGYIVRTEKGLRNEATVLSPGGEFLGVYGKEHPVAFAGETSISRGNYPSYDTDFGKIGTIICYDLDFTDTARKVASNGAQIIGVPSRDWPAIATKHYSHAVFRAVENRVSIIKADIAYDSAIIDPYGNIIEKYVSTEPAAALLTGSVPPGSANTLNMKMGDWVGWLCLTGMAFFVGTDFITAVRKKNLRL